MKRAHMAVTYGALHAGGGEPARARDRDGHREGWIEKERGREREREKERDRQT